MITILKFFANRDHTKKGQNKLLSRTLMKVALIDRHFTEAEVSPQPDHDEFWKCKILKEKKPGTNRGCYIVEPLEMVDKDDVMYLIPGLYEEKVINGCVHLYPKHPGNWIMSLYPKKTLAQEHDAYSVVVSLKEEIPEELTR